MKYWKYYTPGQIISLTALRVLIGWHFLYEGLVKVVDSGWTSKPYLLGSKGPLSLLFVGLAQNDSLLRVIDILNQWGLVLIGLSLFAGFLAKPAKIAGIVLLGFYYMAYPPFAGLDTAAHAEGSYWIVNKNLVEMGALLVLIYFPSSPVTGIDRLFRKN